MHYKALIEIVYIDNFYFILYRPVMIKSFLGTLLLIILLVISLASSLHVQTKSITFKLVAEETENLFETFEGIFDSHQIFTFVTEIFAKEYPFPQIINLKSQLYPVTELKPPRN